MRAKNKVSPLFTAGKFDFEKSNKHKVKAKNNAGKKNLRILQYLN